MNLFSSVSSHYSKIGTVAMGSASTYENRLLANMSVNMQYCCTDILSCVPVATNKFVSTGVSDLFLLIFVYFLHETIIRTVCCFKE